MRCEQAVTALVVLGKARKCPGEGHMSGDEAERLVAGLNVVAGGRMHGPDRRATPVGWQFPVTPRFSSGNGASRSSPSAAGRSRPRPAAASPPPPRERAHLAGRRGPPCLLDTSTDENGIATVPRISLPLTGWLAGRLVHEIGKFHQHSAGVSDHLISSGWRSTTPRVRNTFSILRPIPFLSSCLLM